MTTEQLIILGAVLLVALVLRSRLQPRAYWLFYADGSQGLVRAWYILVALFARRDAH